MLRLIAYLLFCGVLEAQVIEQWREMTGAARQQLQDGKYEAARMTLTGALELVRAAGSNPALEASILNNLGDVEDELGRFSESEKRYKRSITLWESLGGEAREALTRPLNNLAIVYSHMSRHADAERLYLRALSIRTELKGSGHPDLAPILISLCRTEGVQRKYSDGEAHCRQAIAILENATSELHPMLAPAYMNLALLYQGEDELVTAHGWARKALKVAEETSGIRPRIIVHILMATSEIEFDLGFRDQAAEMLQRAQSIAKEALIGNHPLVAEGLLLQARFLNKSNRMAEARKLKEQAMALVGSHRRENSMEHSVDVSEFQSAKK
jgi:tetratricopeptide (TPR) repeat protein